MSRAGCRPRRRSHGRCEPLLSWSRTMLAAVAVALAVCAGAGPAPAADEPATLAPGDHVGITVFDQPDLSGVYLVEGDGNISLPLLGSINVVAFTPKALQAEITGRLAGGYIQNPVVNVRLSELRPVTVVGAVRAAGRYAFIDGMTVETALALAGGSSPLTAEETLQRVELVRAAERVRVLKITELSQQVRKVRLEAQLRDAASFEVQPADDPQLAEALGRFVAAERRIFEADKTAMASQTALLRQQLLAIEGDRQSFADQVASEKAQVDIIDSELADLGGLLTKGITRKSPVQDLQRERSKVQSNLARVLGELARTNSTTTEVKLKLDELSTTYHNRLTADLQAVTILLEQTQASMPLEVEEVRLRKGGLPFAVSDRGKVPDLRISRFVKGRVETTSVGLDAAVRPGDILQVGTAADAGAIATSSRLPEPDAAGRAPGAPDGGQGVAVPGAAQLTQR